MTELYDCIIVGAGPAGFGAALYTLRDRLSVVMLEKFMPGGQIITTDKIENYPAIERIDGASLVMKMQKQVENFGAKIKTSSNVKSLKKDDDGNIVVETEKQTFLTKTVILAPGSSYRKLGVEKEEEFRNAGAGISYCGTCDAPFFKDKIVVAVGGGNTALEEAMHVAKYAAKVTLVHRRDEFRADKILVEELMGKLAENGGNMEIAYDSIVTKINGDSKVESATLKNVKTNDQIDLTCDGVFIFVGTVPNTEFVKGVVDLTDAGFVKCDSATLRTSMPGVFVAGDCRVGAAMQLVTAVSDGVLAAMMIKNYIRDPNWWNL